MSLSEEKIKIIKTVYTDPSGFGSKANTLKDARKKDNTITKDDVNEWFKQYVEEKKKPRGFNSFVAKDAFEEYQMDLVFFDSASIAKIGLLMIDIFTKFVWVVGVKSKQIPDVLHSIKECLNKMGHKPKTIMSDNEGAFISNEVQKYLKEEGINHLTTLNHAAFAERAIRTIKHMIYKRVEHNKTEWYDELFAVLMTYNNKMVHNTTKMTPREAMKPNNSLSVKMNLEINGKNNRKYPDLNIGDKVKKLKKKDKLDKERISTWSAETYTIKKIIQYGNQDLYVLEGVSKPILRAELLKL